MGRGPGKYDPECRELWTRLKAQGVILVVLAGDRGEGYSAKLTLPAMMSVPKMLRDIADEIEATGTHV